VGPDGGTALVAYDKEYTFQTASYDVAHSTQVQEIMPAVDNATRNNHPIYSVPGPELEEFATDTIGNEIANLKRGEQERTKANAKILGDPQMVSGVKVVFQGLAKRRCGGYFITACVHTIGQEGYTTKLDMYWIGDISTGVHTVSTTLSKDDLTKQSKDQKAKKVSMNPNSNDIKKRGYYLKSDFIKGDWELRAEKVDKDWDKKMPGAFYLLTYKDKDKGTITTYKLKVPMNPNGKLDDPFKAFGFDALYDLTGCHDPIRFLMSSKLTPIVTNDPWNNDPNQEWGVDPTYQNYNQH
jgi:hypothetical protein